MSNARRPLESVAVVGSGVVALAAAVALAEALPRARVSLVPTVPPADALADRFPMAMPAVQDMLARLLGPSDTLRAKGVARPRLASRYRQWRADGAAWLVGEDQVMAVSGPPLAQTWLRAREVGAIVPFHALVPGCVAAEIGRWPAVALDAALHLDRRRLHATLAAAADRVGVRVVAPLERAEHGPLGIRSLQLADGSMLTAGLFVDASGTARRLVATPKGWINWRRALPCDRLLLASAPASDQLFDDHAAWEHGWIARWPTTVAIGHADGSEGAARDVLGDAVTDTETVAITPGRLRHAWTGNVLALGDAFAQLGSLGLGGFTLALAQIELALELLPCADDEPPLRDEYNRRAVLRADRLCDFLAAHYHAGNGGRGAFWAQRRPDDLPPGLARKLDQFRQRGLLRADDEESAISDAWLACLLGQDVIPLRPHPTALAISPAQAAAAIAALAADLRTRLTKDPNP